MLVRLGIRQLAYDWRAEHVPTFDAELEALKRHNIRLTAWWFPGTLDRDARLILDTLARHKIATQLWVTGGGAPVNTAEEQRERVAAEATRIRSIAEAAATISCTVALYNHGGWFGEPENQVQIIEHLRQHSITNVGIVYNQHHGHDHVDRFADLLRLMKPHLLALNLNGMARNGDRAGKKILPIAQGELDLHLLKVIAESGWRGPIGILNHTDEDAEARLLDNIEGLEWLIPQLAEEPPGPKPKPRSWRNPASLRGQLPEFKTIPAAPTAELTPANGHPRPAAMTTWHRSHGDAGSTRYSALTQVHRDNVQQLEVAWIYRSNDGAENIQANPIVVDDVMFAPTAGHHIVAIDASTGAELWRFKPEVPTRGMRLEDYPARRGLVYWPGDATASARVLFTCGNWLYALDPKKGTPIESFGENGRAYVPAGGTAAGAVYRRVLVLPGYNRDVFGYHVTTGELLWTFHTLPHKGEFGYETWSRPASGANCWGGIALDEQRGIAYVSTGSPKPNFVGIDHRGDNLFANCVLALDALTGRRLWHFQEIRHDIWDLDIPAPPNLVTVTRDGKRVDAVAQVTKLGNTLLLDRLTGKPLFPFRLRRAPESNLPGEETAFYQPAPELPQPFARQVFSFEHVTMRTDEARDHVLKRIANANFGFFEAFEDSKPTVLYGIHGGAEWTGAAVDPAKGHLYVSSNEIPWIVTVFRDDAEPPRDPNHPTLGEKVYRQNCAACHGADRIGAGTAPPLRGLRHRLTDADVLAVMNTGRNLMPPAPPMSDHEQKALLDFLFLRDLPVSARATNRRASGYTHAGYPKLLDPEGYPGCKPPWGTLNCIDLNTGKLRWQVPLGEYPELTAQGVPITGTENFGGPIVTAGGLVFCAGTRDGCIRAFDADTGRELWKHKLPWGGYAPPATYEINGRQFVVIAATGGGKLGGPTGDAWIAFALPAKRTSKSDS